VFTPNVNIRFETVSLPSLLADRTRAYGTMCRPSVCNVCTVAKRYVYHTYVLCTCRYFVRRAMLILGEIVLARFRLFLHISHIRSTDLDVILAGTLVGSNDYDTLC